MSNLKKYCVSGTMVNMYETLGRVERETKAVSAKKAVNNVRYNLMKVYGVVQLHDVKVQCESVDEETNLFEEAM